MNAKRSGIEFLVVAIVLFVQLVQAQEPPGNNREFETVSPDSFNLKLKTLGGKQFWTDIDHRGGWRIQENAVTNTFRLIDNQNRRRESGSFNTCLNKLDSLTESGQIETTRGRVVIVLHGLIRTTDSMRKLGRYLEEHGDFTAVDFEYASTRRCVADHAAALSKLIESLNSDVTEINFVAHSLGNIVVRHYLADLERAKKSDPRIRRMVMIGPPNQGSIFARLLRRNFLFNLIAGPAGLELGGGWDELETNLATPDFEFGIIAGGQVENQRLSNFVLSGKDDFTVSVEETKLVGAKDFLIKPLLHGTMMRQPVTLEATLSFLEHGYFVSPDSCHPITDLR